MTLKVVSTPLEGTWLVRDANQIVPMGKTETDVSVPVWKYGKDTGGWFVCGECGGFAGRIRADCDHVRAVKQQQKGRFTDHGTVR